MKALLGKMSDSSADFIIHLKSLFSFEGKKLFDLDYIESKNDSQLRGQLVSELNLILEAHSLFDESLLKNIDLSDYTKGLLAREDLSSLKLNRRLLEDTLWTFLERKQEKVREGDDRDLTILDVILDDDIRDEFIIQSRNLIIFSIVYNNIIRDLVSIAKHAHESRVVPASFVKKLLDESVAEAKLSAVFDGFTTTQIERDFDSWMGKFSGHSLSLIHI